MDFTGQTDSQLRAKLKAMGGDLRGTAKRKTLERKLSEAMQKAAPLDITAGEIEKKPRKLKKSKAVVPCTKEEVLAAIKHCTDRGMVASFDDTSWTFQRGHRMDSGNLALPLSQIVSCANITCQQSVSAAALKLS